jgi:hypothetical protein
MSAPGWMASGLCVATTARRLPWTTDAVDLPPVVVDVMRSTCAACPVRTLCDQYAAAARGGFWAGADRDPWGDAYLWQPDPWQAVEWLPVEDKTGHVMVEQAALPFDVLGGAA